MFALNSDITIGQFVRVKPYEVRIERSLYEYVDKAKIKLPITARIIRAGQIITQSVETAKNFNEGDKVIIKLGYNGKLHTEFEGFISRINFTTPLEIECEGYSYILKNRTYKKTFVKTQLIDILQYLVEGTDIKLDEANIPQFVIDKLILQEHSGTEVLELIKKLSRDTIQVNFRGSTLFAGLILTDTTKRTNNNPDVKYRIGWNVIKDDNLKLRIAKNQDVTVKFLGLKSNGEIEHAQVGTKLPRQKTIKTIGSSGSEGETKIIKTHTVTDAESLNKLATEMHTKLSYTGYEGKITAFLQPFTMPGDKCGLQDLKYPERVGTYLVESTDIIYGRNGGRRTIGIGIKI